MFEYDLYIFILVLPMCRDAVSLSKSPDAELNRQRSQLLVAGSQLELGDEESRIPVLITPNQHGYDLCIPAGIILNNRYRYSYNKKILFFKSHLSYGFCLFFVSGAICKQLSEWVGGADFCLVSS